jgi:hypothetical protein
VFRADRKRGPVWYAKYRLPDGRQVQRKIGPAWSERGRPPAGYFTKRLAEDWLRDLLGDARRGTLPGLVRTGATVADAAAEYLRYIEHDRERKPSTVKGYRWIVNAQIPARVRAFQRARKVHKLPANPVGDLEKPPQARSGDIQVVLPGGGLGARAGGQIDAKAASRLLGVPHTWLLA